WSRLRPFFGTVAGLRFNNADLGLFVFQYGLDLLDLGAWREPGGLDLAAQAGVATGANRACRRGAARRFPTSRHPPGPSAGGGAVPTPTPTAVTPRPDRSTARPT